MSLHSELAEMHHWLLSSLHSRTVSLGHIGPFVSFCFDDFPRTAYAVGGAVLKNFNARGTYYAAMGLMNTSNDLGDQFTRGDLDCLLTDGHELASHTFSHISCRTVSSLAFEDDVRKGRHAIREATGYDSGNFSYPYGHVTLAAKKTIGGQMISCRSIYGGLNNLKVDLNLLRANSVYGDADEFGGLQSLLLKNEQQKGWLIFYTHDVRPDPSPFGCTPKLFEMVVARAAAGGARIVPVQEVIAGARSVSDESRSSGSNIDDIKEEEQPVLRCDYGSHPTVARCLS
jgi:peptidoglycan/xylan/chitin deacetylase (PgdA/CDA1 family)